MKLSDWAKENGYCYRTAWNRYKQGRFPDVQVSDVGTIRVLAPTVKRESGIVEIYARVSSNDKKDDLQSQAQLCSQYCASKGWIVSKIHKEVASGMNDNRPKLNKIFASPPEKLVILHKDRITRFGFNYITKLLEAKNCELIVINENSSEHEDLLKDFIAIITSFCCRLYGARRGQAKALKLKEDLRDTVVETSAT